MELEQVIRERRSVRKYDSSARLDEQELREIFERVRLSPSSFNLQHWRFVVVRGGEQKKRMRQAAFGQPQVEEASALIVVCGKLSAHQDADRILADAPEEVRKASVPRIHGFYQDKPDLQRDEAIRSASLAAMSLMLVARERGWATGPMIGFDPAAVAEVVDLPEDHIPVMLMVIGKQRDALRAREPRLALDEIVKLESFTGPGLDEGEV